MQHAVVHGDLDAVRKLVKQGFDINKTYSLGRAGVLGLAIRDEQKAIIAWLLDNGINDAIKKAAVYEAFDMGRLEMVKFLVDRGVDISTAPLYCVVSEDKKPLLKYLLSKKISWPQEELDYALEHAVWNNLFEAVDLLFAHGASVKLITLGLVLKSYYGSGKDALLMSRVTYLLEKGAAVMPKNKDEKSYITRALDMGRVDVAALLLSKGATLSWQEYTKALADAKKNDKKDYIQFLVKHKDELLGQKSSSLVEVLLASQQSLNVSQALNNRFSALCKMISGVVSAGVFWARNKPKPLAVAALGAVVLYGASRYMRR